MPTHGSGIFEPSAICVPEGITGKLTLILEYITSKSIEKTAKGFTLFVDKHWDTIKMQKAVFERDISNHCNSLFDSDSSRIEFVGVGNLSASVSHFFISHPPCLPPIALNPFCTLSTLPFL